MRQVKKLVSKKELKTAYGIPWLPRAHRAPREGRPIPTRYGSAPLAAWRMIRRRSVATLGAPGMP
jgi:hypothetical protein